MLIISRGSAFAITMVYGLTQLVAALGSAAELSGHTRRVAALLRGLEQAKRTTAEWRSPCISLYLPIPPCISLYLPILSRWSAPPPSGAAARQARGGGPPVAVAVAAAAARCCSSAAASW